MKYFLRTLLVFLSIPILIILVIELFAHIIGIPKISNHNIYSKAQDLVPQIDSNTFLILGDSRVEWGIKPARLGKYFRIPHNAIINLAFPGSNGIDILAYLLKIKKYPKFILIGYTPNYGRYPNHNLENQEYSFGNKLKMKMEYFLNQNLYIKDKSILYYLKKEPLYFYYTNDDLCNTRYKKRNPKKKCCYK